MPTPLPHQKPMSCHFLTGYIKHIYSNHIQQVNEQLSRTPSALPLMTLNPSVDNIFNFTFEDFELHHYNPQAHIAAQVAV